MDKLPTRVPRKYALRLGYRSYWLAVFATLCFAVALDAIWAMGSEGDKDFLLAFAQLWLEEKKLYVDIFHPNLPFITWLYGLYVWVSHNTGLKYGDVLVLFTSGIICIVLLISNSLLKQHPAFSGKTRSLHLMMLAGLFFYLPQANFFGDRDHLLTVVLFPYLLRYMPSLARQKFSLRLRLALAVMAAISACIKPHAIVLIVGVQALSILRERSFALSLQLESLVIAGVLCVYLLYMQYFTPEYFTIIIPMLLTTYSANSRGIDVVMSYIYPAFAFAVTMVEFRPGYVTPYRRDILYLLGFIPFCLAYALTNNGWIYTFYPLHCIVYLLTYWVGWEFRWLCTTASDQKTAYKFKTGQWACSANMLIAVLVMLHCHLGEIFYSQFNYIPFPRETTYRELGNIVIDRHAQSFGTVSASFAHWPRIMRMTGRDMTTRFNHLWMIPKFILSDKRFTHDHHDIIEYVAGAYAHDLQQNKTDIVFVDAGKNFSKTGKQVDLVAYFIQVPAFAEAWKHYHLLQIVDHCNDADVVNTFNKDAWCRYEVYERNKGN